MTQTGTIDAADVIGPAGQGIAPGELAVLLAAIDDGDTYVNVHTDKHRGGRSGVRCGGAGINKRAGADG